MFRQDMLQRAIEQLGAARARAAGLFRAAQHAEALECLREAKGALPIVPGIIDDMSVETLIETLGVEQTELVARLLTAEADLLDRLGRSLLGERPRLRSHQLLEQLRKTAASAAANILETEASAHPMTMGFSCPPGHVLTR